MCGGLKKKSLLKAYGCSLHYSSPGTLWKILESVVCYFTLSVCLSFKRVSGQGGLRYREKKEENLKQAPHPVRSPAMSIPPS